MEMHGLDIPLSPRLITFDFGDTIVTSAPSYLERIAQSLSELGHSRTYDEVRRAYFMADLLAAAELLRKAPFSPDEFRESFSGNFFRELGLEKEAPEIAPPLYSMLRRLRPERVMVPGARELIERLHQAGYPMAVISNNDGFTREKCRDVGIADFFLFIMDSTIEGVMKPDPRIFLKALARANLKSNQVLHVGDLWGCDVLGARAAGIPGVWLKNDVVDPEPAPGSARIENPLELLDMLE